MKLTIDRNELLKALLNSSKVARGTDQVLNNLKLDLFEDKLEVTGSNGELTIKTIVPRYKNDRALFRDVLPGSILLNAKMFTEVIRRMDDNEVSISIEDNSIAKIWNTKSMFNLNVTRAEEYRELDFSEEGVHIALNKNDFVDAINQTSFACSIKARAILQCVNIENDEEKITFVATDGSRLAKKVLPYQSEERFIVNINQKNINEVVHTLIEEDDTIDMFISDRKVLFKMINCVIISTITTGEYPNTRNIIPHNFDFRLEVNSDEFLKALDRIVLLSIDRENIVKLTMTEDEVVLSSKSQEIGDAKEVLQLFKYNGGRLEISFNVNYVSQAIKALKCQDILLSFLGEMKPFTVTNKNDENCVQLITPVRTY